MECIEVQQCVGNLDISAPPGTSRKLAIYRMTTPLSDDVPVLLGVWFMIFSAYHQPAAPREVLSSPHSVSLRIVLRCRTTDICLLLDCHLQGETCFDCRLFSPQRIYSGETSKTVRRFHGHHFQMEKNTESDQLELKSHSFSCIPRRWMKRCRFNFFPPLSNFEMVPKDIFHPTKNIPPPHSP